MTDAAPRAGGDPPEDDDRGPIGIFPSWKALYVAVAVATLLMIVLLYLFTVALDYSGP